jgi:pyruvate formate lyase activating enzyme
MIGLNIAKVVSFSTIDELSNAAIVFFVSGCNLDCVFCHNHRLIDPNNGDFHDIDEIKELIEMAKRFVKCVVISGGEPTIQPDIVDVIKNIHESIDLPIFINTNGTNPSIIDEILPLVSGVAMDYKTTPIKYESFCNYGNPWSDIDHSIDLLSACSNDSQKMEIRTTVVEPFVTIADIYTIADDLARRHFHGYYAIQEFDPEHVRKGFKRLLKGASLVEITKVAVDIVNRGFKVYVRSLRDGIRRINF